MYPKQALIDAPTRYVIIEGSTKSGKTVSGMDWILRQAMLAPTSGRNFWWMAPIFGQAADVYRRFQESARQQAMPSAAMMFHEGRMSILLGNGSTISFKSADNPDCYDEATEVLTIHGWKPFARLKGDEAVMTYSPAGQAQWQVPTRHVAYPYDGPMIRIHNTRVDLLVTPNHRMLVEVRRGSHRRGQWDRRGPRLGTVVHWVPQWQRAGTLTGQERIPASPVWDGVDDPELTEDRCALMGFYLAEGSAIGNASPDSSRLTRRWGYRINFAQAAGQKGGTKGDVRAQFLTVLGRLGYRVSEHRSGLLIWDRTRWDEFIGLGDKYRKSIPRRYKDLPPSKLRVLLHWLVLGDGTLRSEDMTYATVSPQLADDVQEIAIKSGYRASIKRRCQRGGYPGRKGVGHGADIYIVKIRRGGPTYLRGRESYLSTESYCGQVYCVSVPNGVLLVRRNGHATWSGNSLYGADVWGVVIDEASRCKEESWHAIRSTVGATGGQIRLIGNVKGRKNWAYRLARQAEAGHPDMTYGKITALDAVAAGVLPMSEVEDARRIYPERVFRELWLAEPSDDEGNPFDMRAIRACIGPLSAERPAVWGIDLGKHVDWTVLIGLDAAGAVATWDRFQKPWPETISTITRIVQGTPTLVDSTGLGDPIVDQLQREAGSLVEGFRFTAGSKQQLMEGLAVAIQEHRVRFPDGPIVRELEGFEYVAHRTGVTYSAPEGLHDDCVCALALAVRHLYGGGRRDPVQLWGGGI